jgi:superfamily II DNA helicase RecQ
MDFLCRQTNGNLSEEENNRRTEVKLKAFIGVVQYCTEIACRRKMLLAYFGENAMATGKNICNKTCDYCVDNGKRIRDLLEQRSIEASRPSARSPFRLLIYRLP